MPPILFLLCPFLYAYFFAVPFGDDFDEATKSLFFLDLPGALYDAGRNWLTWSGRYAYHFCGVLFGWSIRTHTLFALICFAPVAIFFFCLLKFFSLFTYFPKIIFASFCVLIFYSHFYTLGYFYNYMNALSIILQWSAFFIFFLFGLQLFLNPKRSRRWCIISGLFAIGIYEIAALEVFWTCLGFWIADAIRQLKHPLIRDIGRIWGSFASSPFCRIQIWLCGGILFSFLAPGNFMRVSLRPIPLEQKLQQFSTIFPVWVQIIKGFFSSGWIIEIFALTFLACIFRKWDINQNLNRIFLSGLPLILWLLFLFSVSTLLAFSDASLSINSKFADAIACSLALALSFAIYPGLRVIAGRLRSRFIRYVVFLLVILIMASVFTSRNFKLMAINAANGDILRYYQFFREWESELARHAKAYRGKESWPEFGIAGEIKNPTARSMYAITEKPQVTLDEWLEGGFPIFFASVFSRQANAWPNERASWLYDVGSLKVAFPVPKNIFENGYPLVEPHMPLPEPLVNCGVKKVKLMKAAGFGSKKYLWVLVQCEKKLPKNFKVFIPAQVSLLRLLPTSLQTFLYKDFRSRNRTTKILSFQLAGYTLNARISSSLNGWQFLPVQGYFSIPDYIYLSMDGYMFEKIMFKGGG